MKILGVSDINPEAPGFRYAKRLGLFTTTNFKDLYALEGINLIIELTGSAKVRDEIYSTKPSGVAFMGHNVSRLLWDLFQIESEKTALEKEKKTYELKSKKQTQVILDSLPYRIMVVNMDLTVDTVNQTFVREFNINRSSIEGKHCYELRYDLDRPCSEMGRICFIQEHLKELKEKGIFSTVRELSKVNGETRYDGITIGVSGKL